MLRTTDVTDKTFGTSRLREGYEIAEVDRFLSEVAEAIALRDKVIGDLQKELAEARVRPADADVEQVSKDGDRRETSAAAARLLEMATINADQLVAEAQAEADALVTAARAEAEQLITSSRTETERVNTELAQRKEQHAFELNQHRSTVLAEVADQKAAVQAEVDTLRKMESEHRNRLRRHFTEELAKLGDDTPPVVPLAVVGD